MRPAPILLTSLDKSYGDHPAVIGLELEVGHGEIFGFLGPNGAGKTTTIRMMMGLLPPTAGQVKIYGRDALEARASLKREMGFLPDQPVFYNTITGEELLRFVGAMHGLDSALLDKRVDELLEQFGLEDAAAEFAVNYSMGMRKKLALAMASVHDPPLLILDEPTTGLDPMAAKFVRQTLRERAQEGCTVFLSTHLLSMANTLCDRVGIISEGRLVALGTPEELRGKLAEGGSLEDVFFAVTRDEEAAGV